NASRPSAATRSGKGYAGTAECPAYGPSGPRPAAAGPAVAEPGAAGESGTAATGRPGCLAAAESAGRPVAEPAESAAAVRSQWPHPRSEERRVGKEWRLPSSQCQSSRQTE